MQCLDPSAIVYVEPTGSNSGSCTMASPCATIGYAVSQTTSSRSTISMGSGIYMNQAPFVFESGTTSAEQLDIHGHGAVLNGSTADNALYEIGVNATLRDMTIHAAQSGEGLELNFAGAMYELDNVTIDNAYFAVAVNGALLANKLYISNSGTGISDAGLVMLDQAVIHDTTQSAIVVGVFDGQQFEQATLEATNLMIYNAGNAAALDVENGIGSVNFSTIENTRTGNGSDATGANCVTPGVVFHSTIMWTPGQHPAQTGCVFSGESIVGPNGTPTGAMNVDPQFVDPMGNDYHISSTSPAIDQVSSGPPIDFEGDARPQGANYDLGADEYKKP